MLDEPARFREAMAAFPSGVTIVTTADAQGRWFGFTATSFCSVSMDPPLVLVCLAKGAECHPVFLESDRWVIHVLHPEHADLALRFATRGADKFADGNFVSTASGLPVLTGSSVVLECDAYSRQDAGDHTILVGHVRLVHLGDVRPAVYFRRDFHHLAPGSDSGANAG
jgi:flavin reductase ActVB